MKIFLTGSNGQVGWELARSLQPCGKLHIVNRGHADFSDPAAVLSLVDAIKPDVIVNAAAYTAVDAAEADAAKAHRVNAEVPGALATWAAQHGSLLVHYSTDYVFAGTGEAPYRPLDTTDPVSVYGQSKLAGEDAIRASGCGHLLLRTAWVYAARGRNFLLTMLRLASERAELRVVNDQFGTPTAARYIADTTAHCLRQCLREQAAGEFQSGTYHLVAGGYTHWAGFAEQIVALARVAGLPIVAERVTGISTAEYPTAARRPANSRLDTRSLQQRFGVAIPSWQSQLELCIAEYAA